MQYQMKVTEVQAVVTSYMRSAHAVDLETVDLEELVKALTPYAGSPVTPDLEIEILEVVDTRVRIRIPAGWPVLAPAASGRSHTAAHIAGFPRVGKNDLEEMATGEALERTVHMTRKTADQLEAGMKISLEKLSGESASPAPPAPPAPKPADPEKKVSKATAKENRRLAEHAAGTCTCHKPLMHKCPAVRRYGATLPPVPTS
jgi:hypothetical protein